MTRKTLIFCLVAEKNEENIRKWCINHKLKYLVCRLECWGKEKKIKQSIELKWCIGSECTWIFPTNRNWKKAQVPKPPIGCQENRGNWKKKANWKFYYNFQKKVEIPAQPCEMNALPFFFFSFFHTFSRQPNEAWNETKSTWLQNCGRLREKMTTFRLIRWCCKYIPGLIGVQGFDSTKKTLKSQ